MSAPPQLIFDEIAELLNKDQLERLRQEIATDRGWDPQGLRTVNLVMKCLLEIVYYNAMYPPERIPQRGFDILRGFGILTQPSHLSEGYLDDPFHRPDRGRRDVRARSADLIIRLNEEVAREILPEKMPHLSHGIHLWLSSIIASLQPHSGEVSALFDKVENLANRWTKERIRKLVAYYQRQYHLDIENRQDREKIILMFLLDVREDWVHGSIDADWSEGIEELYITFKSRFGNLISLEEITYDIHNKNLWIFSEEAEYTTRLELAL